MKKNYPYLKDTSFLKEFDENRLKEQYVRITVLNWDEKPLESIEGRVTSGSINLDSSSSIRRTANLTMVAYDFDNDLTNVDNIISINKKVELEVGFLNNTDSYTSYPMIWFPLGVYVIITPSITHSTDGVTISLQLKDKMCLLNGECGGTLPASTTFSEYDTVDETGAYVTVYPTIYQIIQEAVNHFGGEQLGKIIISDVDTRIKKVMKWTGSNPLYYILGENTENGDLSYSATCNESDIASLEEDTGYLKYEYGDDVGYIYTDFIYTDELVIDAGGSVTDVLDKIVSYLGNYEYFYDLDGNFVFQEIKNYLNTSQATNIIENLAQEDYLVDLSKGKAVYVFDDSNLITTYSNNPQFNMIKNDFIVWGTRENASGLETSIRYHLAIDSKPTIGNTYQVFFYEDEDDGLVKAKCPLHFDTFEDFPEQGVEEVFYMDDSREEILYYDSIDDFPDYPEEGRENAWYVGGDQITGANVYSWDSDPTSSSYQTYVANYYMTIDDIAYIYKWDASTSSYVPLEGVWLENITTKDWRTELYLSGAAAEPLGIDSNYYYTELKNEWPKLYDTENGDFFDEVYKYPSDIDFFLDFVDTGASISEISVDNIGRRTKVVVDDDVNCVFEPDVPDVVLLEKDADNIDDLRQECEDKGQEYMQVSSSIYSLIVGGGTSNSAYEYVRELLYQYTSYNESVTLTAMPIFYLEPNTRITIRDPKSGIHGDYMIKTMSIPLDTSSTMTISCSRALERI